MQGGMQDNRRKLFFKRMTSKRMFKQSDNIEHQITCCFSQVWNQWLRKLAVFWQWEDSWIFVFRIIQLIYFIVLVSKLSCQKHLCQSLRDQRRVSVLESGQTCDMWAVNIHQRLWNLHEDKANVQTDGFWDDITCWKALSQKTLLPAI